MGLFKTLLERHHRALYYIPPLASEQKRFKYRLRVRPKKVSSVTALYYYRRWYLTYLGFVPKNYYERPSYYVKDLISYPR